MLDLLEVGKRCKRLRKCLKLNQSDVAEQLGYSPQMVSQFENGQANNAVILLWYIDNGLSLSGRGNNYGKTP